MPIIPKNPNATPNATPSPPPQPSVPAVPDDRLFRALVELHALGTKVNATSKQSRVNAKHNHHYYRAEYGNWAKQIMDELGKTHGTIVIPCNGRRLATIRLQWSEGSRFLIDQQPEYENYRAHIVTRYDKEEDVLKLVWLIHAKGTAPAFAQMILQPWQQELNTFLSDPAIPEITINHTFTKGERDHLQGILSKTKHTLHLFENTAIIIRDSRELLEVPMHTGIDPTAYPNQPNIGGTHKRIDYEDVVTPFTLPPSIEDLE